MSATLTTTNGEIDKGWDRWKLLVLNAYWMGCEMWEAACVISLPIMTKGNSLGRRGRTTLLPTVDPIRRPPPSPTNKERGN